MAYASRPLTLPDGMARIDALFTVTSVDPAGPLDRQSFVSFLGAMGFAIDDDIELGVIALPVMLAPEGHYGPPGVYGLFRFARTDVVEAGVLVDGRVPLAIPSSDEDAFVGTIGVPVLLRLSAALRLDTGLTLYTSFTDPFGSRLSFPLTLTVQTSEAFFVGVTSGLDVYHFHDGFGDTDRGNAFIPAGLFLGGTLRSSRGPAGDLRLGWLLPSVTDGTEHWVFGFGGSFYIY